MKNQLLKKSPSAGISLIATVLTLMIFALFIAIAVSLVTTGSNIGLQEEQGMQALFVADGGLEYTVKRNNFPNYGVSPAVNLGRGSFTVSIPTLTVDPLRTSPLPTLTVSSTEGFTQAPDGNWWVMLCVKTNASPPATPALKATFDCEKISFTAKPTATTFTTGTRGRDSSVLPTAGEIGHPVGSVVLMYSWKIANPLPTTIATRTFTTTQMCNSAATTICVTSTANFASSGFVRINDGNVNNIEDVFYDGIGNGTGTCGGTCTACLGANNYAGTRNACIRKAYDGNGNGTANHTAGTTVWQSEISVLPLSTGIIPGNVLTGDIQRKIQLSVAPLK